VWIKHASGHSCQLNGVGLSRTAVPDHVDRQPDGGRIVVDDTGRPTGVLEERAMSFVRDVLLPYPLSTIERALDLATARYAREGLTSVTDTGVAGGWIGHAPDELAAYQNARDRGVLRTRMQVMPVIDALADIAGHTAEPARRGLGGGVRTGWGDEWLQLGPVKIFTDGSVLGRTAYMGDDYEGCPGRHGYLQDDAQSIRQRVLEAYAAGWSLALHAVGDAALDLALDIIEEASTRLGSRRTRPCAPRPRDRPGSPANRPTRDVSPPVCSPTWCSSKNTPRTSRCATSTPSRCSPPRSAGTSPTAWPRCSPGARPRPQVL
jgi:predicted amidohydrolase YtcJ